MNNEQTAYQFLRMLAANELPIYNDGITLEYCLRNEWVDRKEDRFVLTEAGWEQLEVNIPGKNRNIRKKSKNENYVTFEKELGFRYLPIWLKKQIEDRKGQGLFRRDLELYYGKHGCLITGCKDLEVLEAAHIQPHSEKGEMHFKNGLLLRSDIHLLFDKYLIGIEPVNDDYIVRVDPKFRTGEYKQYDGKGVKYKPYKADSQLLTTRWNQVQNYWNEEK
jgi:hypothetical protein